MPCYATIRINKMTTESYDLTTADGWKAAVTSLRKIPLIGTVYAPYFWVADRLINAVSPAKAVEKQAQAASDLIKAGKENGVKKMKIILDDKAGFHFDMPVEGAKINASLGSSGKTTIEVEYA
jgi:hypothetical protein